MLKKIILFFLFCFLTTFCAAQNKAFKEPQTFLQQIGDSTLIFRYTSNWMMPLQYFVISKKSDTITLYKYGAKITRPQKVPQKMMDTLYKLSKIPYSQEGGININFNLFPLSSQSAKQFWSSLNSLKPWTIGDDKSEGESCPKDQNKDGQAIYDGGGIDFILITKNEMKTLSYYAPKFYNDICPGKKGRAAILQIEKMFEGTFGKLY